MAKEWLGARDLPRPITLPALACSFFIQRNSQTSSLNIDDLFSFLYVIILDHLTHWYFLSHLLSLLSSYYL